jgi:hypothetical protein
MKYLHADDELLEQYALGTLGEQETAELEEHLLACGACREQLVQTEEFIRTVRQAAEAKPKVIPIRWNRKPVWAALGVAASLTIVTGVSMWREPAAAPATIFLQPLRGPESGETLPAGRAAVFVMEAPDAPPCCLVEIVDLEGERQASSAGDIREGKLSVKVSGLKEGEYWVRVYRGGAERELLREYRVRAQ